MMLMMLAALGVAETDTDAACPSTSRVVLELDAREGEPVLPRDGMLAAHLPVTSDCEGRVTVGAATLALSPRDRPDDAVEVTLEPTRGVPFAWAEVELEPGVTYDLSRVDGSASESWTFSVVDEAAAPAEGPPSIQSLFLRRLEGSVHLEVVPILDEVPDAFALRLVEVERIIDGEEVFFGAGPARVRADPRTAGISLDGNELPADVCVRARFLSLAGEPGDWSEPYCEDVPDTIGAGRDEGCGCAASSTPASSALMLMLGLLGLRRRSRP